MSDIDIFEKLTRTDDRRPWRIRQVELLEMRVELLEGRERVLLDLYVNHNVTCGQLARLSGESERNLSRLVKRLIPRLLGDEYITIVRNRERFGEIELAVAYDHFLLGLSYRAIREKRKRTVNSIKKIIKRLNLWLKWELSNTKEKTHGNLYSGKDL